MLQVLIGHSGENGCKKMKNAKGSFGSDVVARSIRNHMTQLDTRRSICNALMIITGVIEMFAICRYIVFIGRDFH